MIEENQSNENALLAEYSAPQIREQLLGAFQVLSDSAPSSTLLQKSHSVISLMMKCELFFDTCLLLLEEFQYSKEYSNMPKLIITTLSTFLKHQQASSRLTKRVDRHTLNSKLIAFFTQQSIHEEYRVLLVKSYTQFIFSPGMETIRGQTVEMLCNQFGMLAVVLKNYLSIGKSIPEDQVFHAMSYIFIARALTKGPIELTMMRNIVKVFLPAVQALSLYFLAVFSKAIYEKDEPMFMEASGICSKLIEYFKELVVGTSKENLGLLKSSIMKDPQVKEIIQTTLFLTIQKCSFPPAKQLTQLVIDANGNKYVQRINEIKQNCVAIINHYAKICVTVQSSIRQLEKEEYKVPLEICKYFLYNAPEFIIQEFTALNYPLKALPHPGLFKISLVALSNIVRLHQFFDESFKIRNRLFFHVCLPLMQRNVNQRYHNAEDFKGKREDILNAHCSDIPENAACKLIEAYIDRIDGSVMVFSNALCQAIEFHLTANPNIFSKLPAQLTESSYFKETDYLLQIQAYLSGLSVFSYMSIGRQQLVVMMQELFVSRKNFFFNPSNNGMLKSAILLAYTYYVDNFYTNLKEHKSDHKELHLQILEYCCRNIEEYNQSSTEDRDSSLSLQIGALQSIDCISNCISQKHFLSALFWTHQDINQKVQDSHFYNLFVFMAKQLWGKFNVQVMEVFVEFITEAIKNQCNYGHALKRDHYEYKEVPMVIRDEVCSIIIQEIYKVYNTNTVPNHSLMKCKITKLLELILTCCEFPDQILNNEFFGLKIDDDDVWEIAGPIDIFLRRMIIFKQEGRDVNEQAMGMITTSAINLMQIALKDQKMDKLFGIIVNIIVLGSDGIDDLAICLSNSLVNLLKIEDESNNYDQDLESMIQKLAYLNLIAINDRFSPRTQETWCFLTERIQEFLENRSSKGIIAAKSIPYVGKLLTISLVCIYNMQKLFNVGETEKTIHLMNNILRTADVYVTTAERQIIASIFIELIDSRGKVEEMDDSHKRCFALVSHVLYKAYSKAFKVNKQNYDENDDGSSSSNCDLSEEQEKEEIPNYKEYKIASNEYSKRQKKEKYIHLFKELCHKLKGTSSDFLKSAVEALPLPIQNFVKTQVFYFESGSESSQAMRKVIKVKKESAINE